MFLLSACASLAAGAAAPTRPSMITTAAPGDVVHYFGVGSNMLRSKIVSRGVNGSSIEVLEMRPALVRGHRLAFNMRGFPPLEPGMGGIEESPAEECHGALCTMTAENYEKLWQSEGGAMPNPGYEEIVVEAEGYGLPQRVQPLRPARAHRYSNQLTTTCPPKPRPRCSATPAEPPNNAGRHAGPVIAMPSHCTV